MLQAASEIRSSDSISERRREVGTLDLRSENAGYSYESDAIATTAGLEVLYLSVAGPQTALKALRAIMAQPKVTMKLSFREWGPVFKNRDNFVRDKEGYRSFTAPLGYGLSHMVLMTKREGFMPCLSEEAFWQEISSSRFTTPLLRGWGPAIFEMVKRHPLATGNLKCWGCKCGLINFKTAALDGGVKKLLREVKITIQ